MRGSAGSRLALAAIRGYQRWISPHKGFCCALRATLGGDSCSAYGYRVIERFGLLRGLGLLDRRLELCGHVHRQAAPAPGMRRPPPHPWYHKEQGHCDVPCDAPGCGRRRIKQRSSAQLDALARRIRRREEAQRQRKRRG